MRPLASHEIDMISGAGETVTYNLPLDSEVSFTLERDDSTTIKFRIEGHKFSWNSGTYISCAMLGAGFGLYVTAHTRNANLAMLTRTLVTYGCTHQIKRWEDEDGDENQ